MVIDVPRGLKAKKAEKARKESVPKPEFRKPFAPGSYPGPKLASSHQDKYVNLLLTEQSLNICIRSQLNYRNRDLYQEQGSFLAGHEPTMKGKSHSTDHIAVYNVALNLHFHRILRWTQRFHSGKGAQE